MLFLVLAVSTGIISIDKDYSNHMEIDKLNQKLDLQSGFKSEKWGWSWSVLFVENNLALDVRSLKGNETKELDSVSLDLAFESKLLELGYAISFSRFLVCLSGGGGHSEVILKSVGSTQSVDFPQSIRNPEGRVEYRASSFVLSASGNFILAISDYLGVGVSTGYVHSLKTPKFSLEDREDLEVENAPRMPLNHWYVKFSLDIGDFTNL